MVVDDNGVVSEEQVDDAPEDLGTIKVEVAPVTPNLSEEEYEKMRSALKSKGDKLFRLRSPMCPERVKFLF